MTTEDATTIESKFNLWRKTPWLSVDEAMNLIMGFLPTTYRFDYTKEQDMPDGSIPVYRKLVQAIKDFNLHIYIQDIEITSEDAILYLNELFHENVVSYDEYRYSCWWHNGKLSTCQLIQWLKENDIPSKVFDAYQATSKDTKQDGCIESKEQAQTYDAIPIAIVALQSLPTESILSLPAIKKRVSTEGQDKAQVQNTCRENPEAVTYVEARRRQGAHPKEIAAELRKVGGGVAVIGCLLDPTKVNVDSARERGKYLLKKNKQ